MATVVMQTQEHTGLALSLGIRSMLCKDESGSMHAYSIGLQQYPGNITDIAHRIYLPMEWLLVRFISLPLQQASMVDAEMMFQELADSSDVHVDDWWLSWDLRSCHSGIAGMLFGLPEAWRISMQEHEWGSKTKLILVDGYERLQCFAHDTTHCLILDQDKDGLFFGVYDGEVWRGMCRINGSINQSNYQEMLYASTAMGFDRQHFCIRGRAGQALSDMFIAEELLWQGDIVEDLPSRHEANLNIPGATDPALNLRHDSWSFSQGRGFLKVWKRSLVLCALLLTTWVFGAVADIYRLDDQLAVAEKRIEAAFHQGLPNEPVMLDALAQLLKASGTGHTSNPVFLSSLQAVSQAYRKQPWQLKSLELRNGEMYMAGQIKDIKSLNHIQSMLQVALKHDINITDTNMSGKQVIFRMHW